MSVAGSLIACPPTPSEYSTALDDAHGLALRPWQRPRRDDRQLDAQADRRLETIGDAAPERRDLRVLQAESTAAGDQLGRRLDLDLEPRQRGGAVDHELPEARTDSSSCRRSRPARHRLGLAVPDHGGGSSNPCSRRKRRISSRISRSAIGGTTSRATSRTMRSTAARTSSSPARATEVSAARTVASRAAPSPGSPNPCARSAVRIASSSAAPLSWSSSSAPSTGTSAGALCPSRSRKNTGTWRKCGAALGVRTTSTPETPAPGTTGSTTTTL